MDEDAREVEFSAIAAIYPEIQIDDQDPYTATLEIPVNLDQPVTVLFPAVTLATSIASTPLAPTGPGDHLESDSHQLSHLPSLRVNISLPSNYPQDKPPIVSISTSPPWLPQSTLQSLEGSAEKLWEEAGRDQVVFTFIDDVQRSAEQVFGLVATNGALQVGPEHKIAILDHDIKARKETFEKGTFDCGICLDPKKGTACHKMLDCGHVFCVQCLQDFYNNAIKEGNVAAVQCLEPSCTKEREAEQKRESTNKKKRRKLFISPSELLQIPLQQDIVKRYVDMKYKTELESDKDTVYCPRSWCQGAARSKKHRKPQGLELAQDSDEEEVDKSHEENKSNGKKKKTPVQDRLRVCEDCGFAFCARCGQSWHGEYNDCVPKTRKDAISDEEQKSLEFMRLHTTPCPTCSAPCQKSSGCNHMACFRCQTHFCYLCSSWLDPDNPYRHFNTPYGDWGSGCYMRLWELEEGDNGPGQNQPIRGNGARDALPQIPRRDQANHADVPNNGDDGDDNDDEDDNDNGQARGPAGHQHRQPGAAVEREGPLVLRIDGDAARAPPRRPAPPPAAQQHHNQPAAGRNRGFGRRQRGGGGFHNNNNRNQQQRPQQGRAAPRQQQQQQRQQQQQQRQQQHEQQGDMAIGDLLRQEGELNARQQDWIRNFVAMALQDQEDEIEWDSDEDW